MVVWATVWSQQWRLYSMNYDDDDEEEEDEEDGLRDERDRPTKHIVIPPRAFLK